MKRRAVIEKAIGETRAAIYEGRRLVELHLDRPWQDQPRVGDVYVGRIKSIDPTVAGAWVDIGPSAAPALLPFAAQRNMPKLTEGQGVEVSVLRSQMGDKGATLRYLGESSAKVGRIQKLSLEDRLKVRFPDITIDEASVNAVDDACERQIALPGGGSIILEQTQALLAIDVDKGGAVSASSAANEAAKFIAGQLRLRGLGGLIIIDFPNLRQPKQRKTLERILQEACENDPNVTKFNTLSRFGVIEMTRAKPDISLDDQINSSPGEPSIETLALRSLRRLVREAGIAAGAQMELSITPEIRAWLDEAPFDWRAELTDRIGARFKISMAAQVNVSADR